jgi:hypothetical protein
MLAPSGHVNFVRTESYAMEKAIIVLLDVQKAGGRGGDEYTSEALKELNEHLRQGWSVKQSFAMGGTAHILFSASLVILEKKE